MGSGVHLLGYFFTEHAKQLISRGILYSLIPKDRSRTIKQFEIHDGNRSFVK